MEAKLWKSVSMLEFYIILPPLLHLVCGFDAHFSGSHVSGLRAEEGWQHLQMMMYRDRTSGVGLGQGWVTWYLKK